MLDQGHTNRVDEEAILDDAAEQPALMIERINCADDLALPPGFWGTKGTDT
ncbi:hypothetical protein [Parasedimentitalea maritima]|uniref:hypothetical protein n=1 Tax=Parasedimentitalea maritima TaxID=2578117 RepID=UPI001484D7C9|nr:hypothetical protein [Zongyanglinia marina]